MMNKFKSSGLPLIGIGALYTALGLALILQPNRWSRTPAYGILLDIFRQQVWGTIFIVIAIIISVSVVSQLRALIVVAHTLALAIATAWLAAFVVRWITDDSTTIMNVLSLSTITGILLYSVTQIDKTPVIMATQTPIIIPESASPVINPESARGLSGDPGRDN